MKKIDQLSDTISMLTEIKTEELKDRHALEDYSGCLKLENEIGMLDYLRISIKNMQ
jgi:hypothetical protein